MNNTNSYYKNNKESFTNYQDVKTKTVNWCNKMQSEGLLTPEQSDECEATFIDSESGILPKEFVVPNTGMSRNYSLYNTRSEKLTSKLSNENTNTIMMVTNTGQYMACNSNNDLYFVRDNNDSTINQQELYFTLVPQSNNIYSIISSYGKYLVTNTEWNATFTGTSIGTMSSWNVNKINDKVTLESIHYEGFYLSFKDNNKSLNIIYGKNESIQWLMIPKKESEINNKYGIYKGLEYIVTKENILSSIGILYSTKFILQNKKQSLETLQNTIKANYDEIANIMTDKLNYYQKKFNVTTINYKTKIDSFNNSSTLSPAQKESLSNTIPKPEGINLSALEVSKILLNIADAKNIYLNIIQVEISKIDNILYTTIKECDKIMIDYNKILLDIKNEVANTIKRIKNNNNIMGRQQDNYEKINEDVAYITTKHNQYETINDTIKLNLEIVDGYKQQSSLMVKIYPIIMVLLILFLIYLIYLTSIKFKENIYDKY